jgi:brefeldin A-resistance guanine nucleotide exchange factor 1
LQKAITGFHQCALLSAHYQLHDVFDSIIVSLATMTGLVDMEDNLLTAPDPIVDVAGQKYVISRLAVRFGRNYKGQLAAVVAFAVASEHGSVLRKGWIKVSILCGKSICPTENVTNPQHVLFVRFFE